MKTYKFLALLNTRAGKLDEECVAKLKESYNRLWKIKAGRIATARKKALERLERLAKRTKLPWILMEYPGFEIGRADGREPHLADS